MGQKTVNTFNKGLDFDTSFNKYSNSNYLNGENVRLITSVDYNLNGALSSALGNDEWFVFQSNDEYLIGICEISQYTIVITSYSGGNRVYRLLTSDFIGAKHLNINAYQIRDGLIGASGLSYDRYSDVLDTPVQIIPRPENPDLLKLYIIDGKSQMKVMNVAPSNTGLAAQSPSSFDIVYDVSFADGGIIVDLTSGSLKSGRVQYTYQFYNNNGSETVFSPTYSKMISITKSSESGNSTDYRGTTAGETTNKGVIVTIYNYNVDVYNNYDKVRVVRIQYSTLNQPPTYTIVADTKLSYFRTDIVDTGQDLGSLTSDEVNYLTRLVKPKTMETKNNYLFQFNIEEDTFNLTKDEFDARAYRYDSGGNTYSGTTQFNPYNNLTNDGTGANQYLFQQTPLATTIGGSGARIKYSFYEVANTIDDLDGYHTGKQLLLGVDKKDKGYFRDELYRFGIVFFDKYGRSSFVKWIDDIRMPVSEIVTASQALTPATANDLFVRFNVNIPVALHSKVDSFQIVRCPRTASDRTVIGCGISGHVTKLSSTEGYFTFNSVASTSIYPRYQTTTAAKANILEFITPEYNYNNKTIQPGSRLDLFNATSIKSTVDADGGNLGSQFLVTKIKSYGTSIPTSRLDVASIIGRNYNEDQDNSVNVDGIAIKNYGKNSGADLHGLKGSTPIVQLVNDYVPGANTQARYTRLRQLTYPYGGANINSISFNEFIPASQVIDIASGVEDYVADAIYGDCTIGMFEYNRGIWEDKLSGQDNLADLMYIPVESSIDFNYTVNPSFNTLYNGGTSRSPFYAMHEVAGVYQIDSSSNLYTQDFDLYTYNSVYSQIGSDRVYIAEPLNYSSNTKFPARVIKSELKTNGESTDSWTKFFPNNFKDVDGKFGDGIALYLMNNQLYFFQEKAYGYLPVQEKSVATTSDGQQTVLGIGGVLDRFDYINTGAGITHLRNLTSTQNALYFYDTNNNKICSFSGSHEVLSDKLGVGSFVNSIAQNIYNHTLPVTLIHDYLRNEVSFSFFGLNKSLIYSELAQSFVSMDTYNTLDYYRIGNDVFSCNQNFGNGVVQSSKIYKHNVDILGDIPNYYGVDAPVKIAVVVNPNNVIVNRYDVLSFTFNENTKIDTYRCYNSYQDTGVITVNDENLLRRFRTWRTNTLFNSSDDTRLKDTYLIVEITYSTGTDRIVVSDIVTTYTPLNLWGDNSA